MIAMKLYIPRIVINRRSQINNNAVSISVGAHEEGKKTTEVLPTPYIFVVMVYSANSGSILNPDFYTNSIPFELWSQHYKSINLTFKDCHMMM